MENFHTGYYSGTRKLHTRTVVGIGKNQYRTHKNHTEWVENPYGMYWYRKIQYTVLIFSILTYYEYRGTKLVPNIGMQKNHTVYRKNPYRSPPVLMSMSPPRNEKSLQTP